MEKKIEKVLNEGKILSDDRILELKEIFVDIAEEYTEYNDIKDRIRGLHSFGDITDDEYNYLIQNWDDILKEYNL